MCCNTTWQTFILPWLPTQHHNIKEPSRLLSVFNFYLRGSIPPRNIKNLMASGYHGIKIVHYRYARSVCLPSSLLTCYVGEQPIDRAQRQPSLLFSVQIKPAWLRGCILATTAQLGCSDLDPLTLL